MVVPGPYHYLTQAEAAVASVVAENLFQDHNPAYTYMNSVCRLKMTSVVLGCGLHQLDIHLSEVQTTIGQQSLAFYGHSVEQSVV